jgi:hypothetical protein
MNTILVTLVAPTSMVLSGVIVGILIGVGKVDVSALLLIAPMIMFGLWLLAFAYVKKRFTVDR